jgi:hypothetical protein
MPDIATMPTLSQIKAARRQSHPPGWSEVESERITTTTPSGLVIVVRVLDREPRKGRL